MGKCLKLLTSFPTDGPRLAGVWRGWGCRVLLADLGFAALCLDLGFAVLVYAICVLVGWNIGSRRELVRSWRAEASTANREQAARVAQAQLAERARIAREMHDVVAHSLAVFDGSLHEAAALLGVPPEECRAYEDTDIGMEAILAAGMKAVDVRQIPGVLPA